MLEFDRGGGGVDEAFDADDPSAAGVDVADADVDEEALPRTA
eukprot:CAMPEP_0198129980 /NCGR_PEP_ID=MMETSP1442-20131203/52929_1 /TAXON_ID= /ORGANISM="Craspedostauros australis, Strain CCMP3328" /LENGTH=41 /DNA_ID= /DNA_START= /DNA_END= /DNA_ORIENTATION=